MLQAAPAVRRRAGLGQALRKRQLCHRGEDPPSGAARRMSPRVAPCNYLARESALTGGHPTILGPPAWCPSLQGKASGQAARAFQLQRRSCTPNTVITAAKHTF